jgi:alpha-ketoglutarate-dependent taurine dioxygenase
MQLHEGSCRMTSVSSYGTTDTKLPLELGPNTIGPDFTSWAEEHRDPVRQQLLATGALLLRGFGEVSPETFHDAVRLLCGDPIEYRERSSPRHSVYRNVYTSTDHPAGGTIFLHNEQSYNLIWPLRIAFCCQVPPVAGGVTPLADCRAVLDLIPNYVRRRFEEQGYLIRRHFGGPTGLSWQEAFQTERHDEVEQYCKANEIELEWKDDGELTTRQVRPAIRAHPETGDQVWFNHATFFHVSTLGPRLSSNLIDAVGLESLPVNTFYGNGDKIEPETLDLLRAAYTARTREFTWLRGDVLLVDNMRIAHGRTAFTPPRKIMVAMAEPFGEAGRQS